MCTDPERISQKHEMWLIDASDNDTALRIRDTARQRLSDRLKEAEGTAQYDAIKKAQIVTSYSYAALFISEYSDRWRTYL